MHATNKIGAYIYIGGKFSRAYSTSTDFISVNNFAAWNGTNWLDYDSGVDDTVNVIKVDTCRNLYIGGEFANTLNADTPVATGPLAKWARGADKWDKVGTFEAFNGTVNAISTDCVNMVSKSGCNCDIYITGNFMLTVDGQTAQNVAKYDANSGKWDTLKGGLPGKVGRAIYKRGLATGITGDSTKFLHVAGDNFYQQYSFSSKEWIETNYLPTGIVRSIEYDPEYFSSDNLFFGGDFDFPISDAVDAPRCKNVCGFERKTKKWFKMVKSDGAEPNSVVNSMKLVGANSIKDGTGTLFLAGGFTNTGSSLIAKVSASTAASLSQVENPFASTVTSIDACSKTDLYCKENSIVAAAADGTLKFYDAGDNKAWIDFGDLAMPLKKNVATVGDIHSVMTWNYVGAASATSVLGYSSAFVMFFALIAMLF